jgi:hypothetical protein
VQKLARHDKMGGFAESNERGMLSNGHHRITELVKTTMTADSLQLTAYGPDDDQILIVEDPPKAKTPPAADFSA